MSAGIRKKSTRRLSTAQAQSSIETKHLQHPILFPKEERESVFTDFGTLVAELRKELQGNITKPQDPATAERITNLLSSFRLNPKEWGQYTHFIGNRYTRTLVGFDPNFAVLLLCWERGQMSPIHSHASSSCWVKVLDGQLQETIYEMPPEGEGGGALRLVSEAVYNPNEATYIDDSHGIHKMGNPRSDTPCVSLHIYSPPYSQCYVFDRVTSMRKLVSLGTVYQGKRSNTPAVEDHHEEDTHNILNNVDKISLDTFVERVNLELDSADGGERAIGALLEKLVLSPDEWERFVNFGERNYTRNLLLLSERFSVMLLCWNPGQSTPPHRHGEDRHSWFKVLSGELKMVHFKDDEEMRLKQCSGLDQVDLQVESSEVIDVHSPVIYEGPDDASHQLGNRCDDSETAVSLHVYSPPYLQLTYECSNGEEKKIPVVHYGQMFSQIIESYPGEWRGGEIFSNLSAFQSLLDDVFIKGEEKGDDEATIHERITNLMSQIQINPEEWRMHARLHPEHFTRVLIGQSEKWMLILTCWDKDQGTPIHDHQGSFNWIKILDGQLLEENYVCNATKMTPAEQAECEEQTQKAKASGRGDGRQYAERCVQLVRSGVLPPDSVTYLNRDIIHRIRNVSGRPAFSLHLYAPPYVKARAYDVVSGGTELVFLPQEKLKSATDSESFWHI